MSKNYILSEEKPTLEEYKSICTAVGWGDIVNFDVSSKALDNSIYSVVARHNGKAIGMGRIVGDGAIFYYIQDIAVLPEYQKKGIGKMIMDKLLDFFYSHASEKAFLGLFSVEGVEGFYERFGFKQKENRKGMCI
jgi:ribosomal protein S18 acetylase RimI-like enzyme